MGTIDFGFKTINDPVHGSIKLSKTELAVVDTPSFQRLRGLKQLGLADLVFPGASHSRFAHSLGVLHIVSQMLEAIERNHHNRTSKETGLFNPEEKQKIRLAALLHDIGHLPLSHAMEHPLQRIFKETSRPPLEPMTDDVNGRPKSFGFLDDTANAAREKNFKHESFGQDILEARQDLAEAIKDYNHNNEIGKIFTKGHIDIFKYSQFVTGTLDADRLDFLLRDSLAAGVSYGNIDLKYLLDNIEYDSESKQFYINYSGIHALEHFITSRFFLYNVTYHKTVMGFELLAKYAYYKMAKDRLTDVISSKEQLYSLLNDTEQFLQFDDHYFWKNLRDWPAKEKFDDAVRKALLFRHPARELFAERELTEPTKTQGQKPFRVLNSQLYDNAAFDRLIDRHGIERNGLAMLENDIGFEESAPTRGRSEEPDEKKEWALCKVFYDDEIKPLIDVPGSIIQRLSYLKLNMKRLYYLPLDPHKELRRDTIRREIRQLAPR